MKVNLIRVFSVALVLLLVGACSSTTTDQRTARASLAKKGISYYSVAFISAAKYGKTDVVKEFLAAGMDVNINVDGTALIAATASKNLGMVKLLVENGADVNEYNYLGTALSAAAYVGSTDIAKYLIDNGADVNIASADGVTALIIAAENGKPEMVEYFLKSGANENYQVPVTGLSPLILAASKGHLSTSEQLVKGGADVNYKDYSGMSVLDWAMYGNYTKIAEMLIKNGARVDDRAVIAALGHSDATFLPILIKYKMDVNGKAFGKMPYLVWCAKNRLPRAAEMLLKNGANPNATDENGCTALDYALATKEYSLVKVLDPSIDINTLPKREGDPNLKASSLQFVSDAKLGDEDNYTVGTGTGLDGIDSSDTKYNTSDNTLPDSGSSESTLNAQNAFEQAPNDDTANVIVPGQKQNIGVNANKTIQASDAMANAPTDTPAQKAGLNPNAQEKQIDADPDSDMDAMLTGGTGKSMHPNAILKGESLPVNTNADNDLGVTLRNQDLKKFPGDSANTNTSNTVVPGQKQNIGVNSKKTIETSDAMANMPTDSNASTSNMVVPGQKQNISVNSKKTVKTTNDLMNMPNDSSADTSNMVVPGQKQATSVNPNKSNAYMSTDPFTKKVETNQETFDPTSK